MLHAMCEERQKLLQEFCEAAEAFSAVLPDFRKRESFDPAELASTMDAMGQRVDQACAALKRHDKEHRC